MKILYGIQATGNGHISRARELAKHFNNSSAEMTYLFSGREKSKLFDMECFGDFLWHQGLTFFHKDGNIDVLRTVLKNNSIRFLNDIFSLPTQHYDLVITDYEPITAWAAKYNRTPSIGIGHQYAFSNEIPVSKGYAAAKLIMKWFAPTKKHFGLHWHHFDSDILPPIIDTTLEKRQHQEGDYILVYLPFENQSAITHILQQFPEQQFYQYSPELSNRQRENVSLSQTNHDGFKNHLSGCSGVICNTGFELISECLQLHVPILTKPMQGQIEQLSNALALEQLAYATVIEKVTPEAISHWLHNKPSGPRIQFPNVAKAIAKSILNNDPGIASKDILWNSKKKAPYKPL